ncbi:hypothetical protein BgiMline_019038 [Biomphalaria glabrata]|uniref:Uncharacterized protein LOC106068282 n=1 Tax=Biomphalaria glabrata TaxID=6526 RepID=A0A9W3B0N1_BIOGL|nr:uncharacterized protein LOC106068282 [Biomphalaria glabrata]KAI8763692.1 hypothetical protein BgiMline_006628 [Biomphalaria glabrata]
MSLLKVCGNVNVCRTVAEQIVHCGRRWRWNDSIVAVTCQLSGQHIFCRNVSKEPNFKKHMFKPNHYWDNVPRDYTLVYDCHLKYWLIGVKTVPLVSGVFLGSYYGYNFENINQSISLRDQIILTALFSVYAAVSVYVNIMARSYFQRIYYNGGQFIAVRRSVFGRLKQLKYTISDVTYDFKKELDSHYGADVKIKNTKCHLFATDFITPVFYNMHLGDQVAITTSNTSISDFPKF